ncbi:DUF6457 domain-containing protein [Streptomyces sp. NPDC015232]|uniref:DUF6457 domain-containing protein n=1 Tax=unclassified Streptomyces TaxID=2593676 RepID=UPI0036F63B5F
MTSAYDALVLAGGAARRLGGADKPGVRVGGRPLLDRVLAGCRDAGRTVVVAAPRATARPVEWTREEPPGGGPVAALDAGLRRLAEPPGPAEEPHPPGPAASSAPDPAPDPAPGSAEEPHPLRIAEEPHPPGPAASSAPDPAPDPAPRHRPGAPLVLVLSADLPFFDAGAARLLVDALEAAPGAEGAVAVDREGREQPLVAVYRAGALRGAVARAVEEHGGPAGLPLRRVTGELTTVAVPVGDRVAFDCDTWEDIVTARARIREHGTVLDEWITAVKDELGIDLDVDTGLLLDLARDAAHGVARPAAPLTTFLVGYAAASAAGAGGGREAVAEAAAKAAALAQRWAAEQDEAG